MTTQFSRRETQESYLLIADITGFTSYMANTELEHANEIITELLELLVKRLGDLLSLVEVEGDAVYMHVPTAQVPRAETLLELIEATYLHFRGRVDMMRRRTTCDCDACRAIPSVDLKFILHRGESVVQKVAGISKLFGTDINLLHRLTKNNVGEETGWSAYVLLSGPAYDSLGTDSIEMHGGEERYEHLGTVRTYSYDLGEFYEEHLRRRSYAIKPEDADYSFTMSTKASPPIVWEWLNDPVKRAKWQQAIVTNVFRPEGRNGIGARTHCDHGNDVVKELILDWKPFDYYTVESTNSLLQMNVTLALKAKECGTEIEFNALLMSCKIPLPRVVLKPLFKFMMDRVIRITAVFTAMIEMMEAATETQPEHRHCDVASNGIEQL